jgi:hypothetical protein
MNTYIATWYVNGIRDVGVITEDTPEIARAVVRTRLAIDGLPRPDGDKVRLREVGAYRFTMLSHGGHA